MVGGLHQDNWQNFTARCFILSIWWMIMHNTQGEHHFENSSLKGFTTVSFCYLSFSVLWPIKINSAIAPAIGTVLFIQLRYVTVKLCREMLGSSSSEVSSLIQWSQRQSFYWLNGLWIVHRISYSNNWTVIKIQREWMKTKVNKVKGLTEDPMEQGNAGLL